MFLNVIKAEDNRKYVECKDYTIFINNDDGTVSPRKNFLAMADRLWVEEEVICNIGGDCIYEIMTKFGTVTEGKILEQGVDEHGNYIVFLNFSSFDYIFNNKRRPNLLIGRMELNLVLSTNMIPGSEDLVNHFKGSWPSFHEAMPEIVERTAESIAIRFSGGFLGYIVVDMKVTNIANEKCDNGFMDSLGRHGLTDLDIRKAGDNFELRLYNDYVLSTLPEDFDRSVFEDPEFDIDTIKDEYIVEEHTNHWFITCEKIEIKVSIDDDKKRQQDEEYEEFLREVRGE